MKVQCEAYTARVCPGSNKFRNWHCLLCIHVDVPETCCTLPGLRPYSGDVPLSTMLLEWSRLKEAACAPSEKYEPISRVCRKIFIRTLPKIMRENFPSSLLKARPKNTVLQDGQIHPMFRISNNNCVCVCVCVRV